MFAKCFYFRTCAELQVLSLSSIYRRPSIHDSRGNAFYFLDKCIFSTVTTAFANTIDFEANTLSNHYYTKKKLVSLARFT